jgi:hypothetical protein
MIFIHAPKLTNLSVLHFFTFFSFLILISAIKHEYWHTFINTQRGRDLTCWAYNNAETDKAKAMVVFTKSRNHWKPIEDEVRDWVESSWENWVDGQPSWFREGGIRANIPIEFIPNLADRKKMKKLKRRQRRRTSFLLRGRESFKNSLKGSQKPFNPNSRKAVKVTKTFSSLAQTLSSSASKINPAETHSPDSSISRSKENSISDRDSN